MPKTSIITGAVTLTASSLIVRALGFFYRIHMVDTIGDEGMGLFQLIMPIYMLMWSITASGFTTTISKMTSFENAGGFSGNIGTIVKKSISMCIAVSIAAGLLLFILSDFIAINILKDIRISLPLKALSAAIPFMSAGSCIRGCFFGMQETKIPAISQVIEQIIRLLSLLILAPFLVNKGLTYAALAAVIGIALGEALSFLYVFICYIKFSKEHKFHLKPNKKPSEISYEIIKMAFPLTMTRITASALVAAENILIPIRLGLFSSGGEPLSVYGRLTGMAMPLIQLPSSFLVALATSIMPAVSSAKAIKKTSEINKTVSASLLFTITSGICAAVLFALFSKELCIIIYNQRNLASLVMKLSFIAPFMYLQITLSGILNGLGNQIFLFKLSLLSSVINVFFIYFLIPVWGVNAFILGNFASLITCSLLSLNKLKSQTKLKTPFLRFILKPLLSALASGLITKYIQSILPASRLTFLILVLFLILSYFALLILSNVFSFKDLNLIFSRKKRTKKKSAS